jgi:hypothetical protein
LRIVRVDVDVYVDVDADADADVRLSEAARGACVWFWSFHRRRRRPLFFFVVVVPLARRTASLETERNVVVAPGFTRRRRFDGALFIGAAPR